MSLTHKTSEAFAPKDASTLRDDNVVQFDRIFAVKGRDFHERFMSQLIMPMRQDVALMALQQVLAAHMRDGESFSVPLAVRLAFAIADEFCLQAPVTADARLADYFKLYMSRGEVYELIKSQMDVAHDWSV